jgi:hypothetical protein
LQSHLTGEKTERKTDQKGGAYQKGNHALRIEHPGVRNNPAKG